MSSLSILASANMRGLTSPLELYRLKLGAYPTSLDDLYQLPRGITQEAWGGPYLDGADKLKDVWGRPLRYKAPGVKNPKWYDLWSAGKDGVSGTKDDIKNW
jgi:general secretion pathway protein G